MTFVDMRIGEGSNYYQFAGESMLSCEKSGTSSWKCMIDGELVDDVDEVIVRESMRDFTAGKERFDALINVPLCEMKYGETGAGRVVLSCYRPTDEMKSYIGTLPPYNP